MRRMVLAALILAGTLASMGFLPQFGSKTVKLGDVASVRVPRKARLDDPRAPDEHPTWVAFRMDRVHAWAMGSGTPYRANLFVSLHAQGAAAASYADALKTAERALNGGGDGWRPIESSDHWEIGEGRYTVNMLKEPTWRLEYRDPSRRVSALWQVFQKDWPLDDARKALVTMVESVQRLREPDFAEIADRPRRGAEENQRKHDAALAVLARHGFAPLRPGEPVTKDGITVEYMSDPERRVMLYMPIAGKPKVALPPYVTHGWRTWSDAGWENMTANNDYYAMPGTRRMLDAQQAKPGPHHFLIRTIRLDVHDESSHHIEDFLAFAATMR